MRRLHPIWFPGDGQTDCEGSDFKAERIYIPTAAGMRRARDYRCNRAAGYDGTHDPKRADMGA
jgi:hypothetical protein